MKLQFIEMAGFRGFRDRTRFEVPAGFLVLSGGNGSGKSTFFDAIDFAITGTINKFSVREAKGGGLDEHIWWVGSSKATEHFVSLGFVGEGGKQFEIRRSREREGDVGLDEFFTHLGNNSFDDGVSLETLMRSTLIRGELIASLSLDLPEQARFAAVRAAIGNTVGPDYSDRTAEIVSVADDFRVRAEKRVEEAQKELGRALEEITRVRSNAERSAGVADALQTIQSIVPALPSDLTDKIEILGQEIARRRILISELETALPVLQSLSAEWESLQSPSALSEREAARVYREEALQRKMRADEALALATNDYDTERSNDEFAAHLAALLEHGSALGLQNGHCPLCEAVRRQEEFENALLATRQTLKSRGTKITEVGATLTRTRTEAAEANRNLAEVDERISDYQRRQKTLEEKLKDAQETCAHLGIVTSGTDPAIVQSSVFSHREELVRLEQALSALEASVALDQVKTLEIKITALREHRDKEEARLVAAQKALEAARQIDSSGKNVANQILTEQFDTIMPLLRELYRRLRPHAHWTEIEIDFGGKVRGSLNFTVGNRYNPQFLFSTGQRRTAGLAFLLAVHLSRPWCKWESLLIDDPVQHIDDYRALNLIEVLAGIRRTGRQVIVAVEDMALANALCRKLRGDSKEGKHYKLCTSQSGATVIAEEQDIHAMPQQALRSALAS